MKPWGLLDWVIEKTPRAAGRSLLIGCIGAEERSTVVPFVLRKHGIGGAHLFTVTDPLSRYSERIQQKTDAHIASLVSEDVGRGDGFANYPLFADDDMIASIVTSVLTTEATELWIDITAMPKRFFFLLIKLALLSPSVVSLFVTYSLPAAGRYTPEHLSEDPDIPQPLPGFGPMAADAERLVVSIGFEPLGLAQVLGEYRDRKRDIVFLVPFPPGQPYSRRIWETIRSVGFPGDHKLRRVPALDAFGTFDALTSIVPRGGAGAVALAPYGPKPMSLGMCIYAAYYGAPVYYTQPRVYHPDYTLGAGSAWAYCLRLGGRDTFVQETAEENFLQAPGIERLPT